MICACRTAGIVKSKNQAKCKKAWTEKAGRYFKYLPAFLVPAKLHLAREKSLGIFEISPGFFLASADKMLHDEIY